MDSIVVVKLGGSVLESPQGFADSSLNLSEKFVENGVLPIIVVSAMKGVTDLLLEAARGSYSALDHVESTYMGLARELGSTVLERTIMAELRAARRLLEASKAPIKPETIDAVVSLGERLSRIAMEHYLVYAGLRGVGFDARSLIVTNRMHGDALIIEGITRNRVQVLLKAASKGLVPVIEGFVGSTPEGAATTLGRGGSDYTATVLAKLLRLKEVYLVSDVDGVYSIDPSIDREAALVPRLSLREAMAASAFRVKGFNRKTFLPLQGTSIIVNVGSWNKFGTRISGLHGHGKGKGLKILAHKSTRKGARIGVIGCTAKASDVKRILEITDSEGFSVDQVVYSSGSPLTSILVSARHYSKSLEPLLRRIHREVLLRGSSRG